MCGYVCEYKYGCGSGSECGSESGSECGAPAALSIYVK